MTAALDLPFCAVCRTRVASLEHHYSQAANRGLGGYTLIAHCHGERELVDISEADLLAMRPDSIRAGVAFQRGAYTRVHRAELDLRDVAFNAPRPYQASSGFRYEPHHGDAPNGPQSRQLNGLLAFRVSSPERRHRTR